MSRWTRFQPYEREQALLLPQDMREWLPEDDLAYFIPDVVATVDLRAESPRPAGCFVPATTDRRAPIGRCPESASATTGNSPDRLCAAPFPASARPDATGRQEEPSGGGPFAVWKNSAPTIISTCAATGERAGSASAGTLARGSSLSTTFLLSRDPALFITKITFGPQKCKTAVDFLDSQ